MLTCGVRGRQTNVTCSACGRGRVFLGLDSGMIVELSRDLTLRQFQAFSVTVTHLVQLHLHDFLLSVGVSGKFVGDECVWLRVPTLTDSSIPTVTRGRDCARDSGVGDVCAARGPTVCPRHCCNPQGGATGPRLGGGRG